jgi:RNA polymerase sigma-70 factor (ECF subfamily)
MDDILQNIKAGDLESFRTAYQLYHEKLFFYVVRHTRSTYLAEETVQMTFIKCWENKENLSSDVQLSQQLFRIAKSTLIDLLRKESRRKTHLTSLLHQSAPPTVQNPDLQKKEELSLVFDTIEQMAPVRREVFKLSRLDGYSHKEIATRLSISPKTVENHIGRAIRQLKDALVDISAIFF